MVTCVELTYDDQTGYPRIEITFRDGRGYTTHNLNLAGSEILAQQLQWWVAEADRQRNLIIDTITREG